MRGKGNYYEDELQTLLELTSPCKYDCDVASDCMTCLSERINILNAKRDHASAFNG
jgi:hypothetical protein